jgi:hypothetical protein
LQVHLERVEVVLADKAVPVNRMMLKKKGVFAGKGTYQQVEKQSGLDQCRTKPFSFLSV